MPLPPMGEQQFRERLASDQPAVTLEESLIDGAPSKPWATFDYPIGRTRPPAATFPEGIRPGQDVAKVDDRSPRHDSLPFFERGMPTG